ncbi:hypothetical protein M8J77_011119 [Diaphorina citri]|nr:hypothetical protein M8J77_011119 [Diaphorina citri]
MISHQVCMYCTRVIPADPVQLTNHCKNCQSMPRENSFDYRFMCYTCRYFTYHAANIKKHIYKHLDEKPHKCNICPYSATEFKCLRVHKSKYHVYQTCQYCKLQYASDTNKLIEHCKTCSSMPRQNAFDYSKFMCFKCPFVTFINSNMRRHINKHIGEKPYKCTLCKYSAIENKCLKLHMLSHHNSDYTPPPVQALLECHASDDKELGLIELALSNEPKLHSLKVLGMDSKKRVRKRCKGCYQELVMKGGPAYARVKAPLVNTICETCNIPLCSLCFQTHAETL